jgi:hypothetical protein
MFMVFNFHVMRFGRFPLFALSLRALRAQLFFFLLSLILTHRRYAPIWGASRPRAYIFLHTAIRQLHTVFPLLFLWFLIFT